MSRRNVDRLSWRVVGPALVVACLVACSRVDEPLAAAEAQSVGAVSENGAEIDQGIGPIRLGMSKEAFIGLGLPMTVSTWEDPEDDHDYNIYQVTLDPQTKVDVVPHFSDGSVTNIQTRSSSITFRGVGPGSTLAEIKRAFPEGEAEAGGWFVTGEGGLGFYFGDAYASPCGLEAKGCYPVGEQTPAKGLFIR